MAEHASEKPSESTLVLTVRESNRSWEPGDFRLGMKEQLRTMAILEAFNIAANNRVMQRGLEPSHILDVRKNPFNNLLQLVSNTTNS
jgi:hypothetical protein